MKNNIIKCLAILLSFASIITLFAACSKNDESALLYKKDGKFYYRKDTTDDAYELATDENGVTRVTLKWKANVGCWMLQRSGGCWLLRQKLTSTETGHTSGAAVAGS